MSIKLLFDLWPLIQFTIFEEEICQIEEEPCKCPSEEESIQECVFLNRHSVPRSSNSWFNYRGN